MKQASSLKGSTVRAVTHSSRPINSTAAATTGTIISRPAVYNTTVMLNRTTATSAQPVRRPTTSASSYKLNATTSSTTTLAIAPRAVKRTGGKSVVVGRDAGVDVLVLRGGPELEDDFRFEV